jgi:hypothetical protein
LTYKTKISILTPTKKKFLSDINFKTGGDLMKNLAWRVAVLVLLAVSVGILAAPTALMSAGADDKAKELRVKGAALSTQELKAIRSELSVLTPPATREEAAMYKGLKNDPALVKGFIATRRYLRLIGFPGKIDVVPSKAPRPPSGVDYRYTLNFDEEFPLFQIFLSQGISSK